MSNFFTKCNMVIRTSLDFYKCGVLIKLPFKFHIKDIKYTLFDTINENILEDYSQEFNSQFDNARKIQQYMSMLKYIDIQQFTIDDSILEEYREEVVKHNENYVFKSNNSLYSFLVHFLMFSELDFNIIQDFIYTNQKRLIESFTNMAEKEIGIGVKSEKTTESFMQLRCAFELNKPPLFEENIGLNITAMSYRELILQRIYIARKCEVEQIQYDNIRNNSKGG